MIKHTGKSFLLALIGALGFFSLSGCNKEGDVLTPTELAPPTNMRATSGDARVYLTWTASPDAGSSDFAGYRIVTKTALGVMVDSNNTAPSASSYTVAGLINGGVYTFTIQSVKTNGSVSVNATLQWGSTVRYGFQSLYEYDSNQPSGLQFLAGQRFNFTNANQAVIDLWIDGRASATPLLKSPDDYVPSTGWRRTLFVETSATTFDEYVVVPDVAAFRSTPGLTIVSGKVYFAITQGGNYVKFRVEPPGVQVDPANSKRFVNITVAYNSGVGHWAKPLTSGPSTLDN
ncbi:MAG: fibronectin type III domain-containing protein [bacterium]